MTEQTIKAEKNEAKAEAAPAMSGELAAILKQINGLKPEERKALHLQFRFQLFILASLPVLFLYVLAYLIF